MDFQRQTAILATASVQDTIDLSKAITEYGILVVIAAVFLIVSIYVLRRMINSYTKTVDGVIPKIEEVSKSINDLQRTFNEVMSAHNAHTNQSLRSLERDSKEIRENFTQCHRSLMELESAINSLQANYNTLLRIIIGNNGMRRMLPDAFVSQYDNDAMFRDESHPYHDTVYEKDGEELDKKDGDESK